jgi:hypothetical protein
MQELKIRFMGQHQVFWQGETVTFCLNAPAGPYLVTPEIIARLSPYKTEHINRFGHYELRFDHVLPPVTEELRLSPALSTRELERG